MTPSLLSKDNRFTKCQTLLSQLGITTPEKPIKAVTQNKSTSKGFYLSCPAGQIFNNNNAAHQILSQIPAKKDFW